MKRYTIETYQDNGKTKFKKDKIGKKVVFIVQDATGGKNLVVDRSWVIANKDYISNVNISGKSIYPIEDRYEKACNLVYQGMCNDLINGNGVRPIWDLAHIPYDYKTSYMRLTQEEKVREAWSFLLTFEIDFKNHYMAYLKHAIKEAERAGHKLFWFYADQNGEKVLTLINEGLAEKYKQFNPQPLDEYINSIIK